MATGILDTVFFELFDGTYIILPPAPNHLRELDFFRAVLEVRLDVVRRFAADLACFDKARWEAAEWPSRFSARFAPADLLADVFFAPVLCCPRFLSCSAFFRVASEAFPFF
ncbi:MAG TPA: hypothetical protein VN737_13410, partial [Bryobacteraceae bacterium]|nr:hypothetical protein [Bryobacteraceae bacterium]